MEMARKKELAVIAEKIRLGIIEATHAASSGHPGGSLSIAEIITYLYFEEMNVDPKNPTWEGRDRFVLSKGHTAPALYAALAEKGYFEGTPVLSMGMSDSYEVAVEEGATLVRVGRALFVK